MASKTTTTTTTKKKYSYDKEKPTYSDEFEATIKSLTEQLKNLKPSEYNSQYLPIIESLQKSLDDGTFFNAETDERAKQLRTDYTRGAKQALEDTIAEASKRTGGLASSYATAAAQQQYNKMMDEMAGKVLDLRDLAEASTRNNINNYWNLENDAYNKWANAYKQQRSDLGESLNAYQNLSNNAYARYQDLLNDYWKDYTADFQRYQQEVAEKQFDDEMAYKYAALAAQQAAQNAMGTVSYGGGKRSTSSYGGSGGGSDVDTVKSQVTGQPSGSINKSMTNSLTSNYGSAGQSSTKIGDYVRSASAASSKSGETIAEALKKMK